MMRRRLLAAGVAIAAVVVAANGRAHACAGCRNPNMPITRLDAVHLAPGEVRAALVVAATSLHIVHPAGCPDPSNCMEVPVQPTYLHDQRILPGELRPVIEVGLANTLGAELHIPFRLTRTTIKYALPDGTPYQPVDAGVHHRDETLAGIGDPWLLGRWNTIFGSVLFTARGGVSLPLGRTEENPFALGALGARHQHIQFGSGTFDPVVGVDLSKGFGKWQVASYGQAQTSLYQNSHGFRAGSRFLAGGQLGRILVDDLTGAFGVDVMHEGAERWDGRVQQDGNLGRTELLAALSVVHSFGASALALTARVPVWRHLVVGDEPPGTLSSPLMLSVAVSHSFTARRAALP